MKFIVFCICVLGFALSNLADSEIKQPFKNDTSTTKSNLMTCFIKHNITKDDVYYKKILPGVYVLSPSPSGNKEMTRKLGCAFACFLTKEDLMEGSNIKESKVHVRINQIGNITRFPLTGQVHELARDCMNEVKDITEECEKSFSLFVCAVKAISSKIDQAVKNAISNLRTCLTEHNVTAYDVYYKNILPGVYAKPLSPLRNKEMTRKLGCAFACFLTKEDLMEDSNIKESKVHVRINQIGNITRSPLTGQVHELARDCMNEVKDITEECEKSFSLFVCAVKAISSKIEQAFKNAISNLWTCLTEHNVPACDSYNYKEIITGVYAKPGNKEKTRKLGCALACFLTKQDLMEGSNIKESKVHALINQTRIIIDPSKDIVHKVARDCMKKVKDITEKCEKSFSLFICAVKAVHKLERHGEHEEREGAEIQDNEEAEQTV